MSENIILSTPLDSFAVFMLHSNRRVLFRIKKFLSTNLVEPALAGTNAYIMIREGLENIVRVF